MVVEVFITQGQGIDPLPQQTQAIMVNARLAARIIQGTCYRFIQTQTAVHLLQQQHTAIRSDIAALEIGRHNTSF